MTDQSPIKDTEQWPGFRSGIQNILAGLGERDLLMIAANSALGSDHRSNKTLSAINAQEARIKDYIDQRLTQTGRERHCGVGYWGS